MSGRNSGHGLHTLFYKDRIDKQLHTHMRIRFYKTLLPALLCVAGCTEEIADPSINRQTIRAVLDDGSLQTRTCVAEVDGKMGGIMWSPTDVIGVFSADGMENAPFSTDLKSASGEADFSGELLNPAAYAYYPYSQENAGSRDIKGNLPLVQEYSYSAGSLSYDYKYGVPKAGKPSQFTFSHLFSLLRFTVDARGTALAGDRLEEVTITFPEGTELNHGDFTFPVTGGDAEWVSAPSGNVMKLKWSDNPSLVSGNTYYGYLACPPVSGLLGKDIKVELQTSKYHVGFSATLKADSFVANAVYTFPLSLSKWADKLGDDFVVAERPVLTAVSFKAADNAGKILSKGLYYDASGSNGIWTKSSPVEGHEMIVADGKITGLIHYLNDRNLVPEMIYTDGASLLYSTDEGISFTEWDGSSAIDFTAGTIIRVAKGDAFSDYVCEIRNSGLPVVVINQPGGDTDWKNIDDKIWSKETDFDKVSAGDITIYNEDGSISLSTGVARARLRGNTSLSHPKKSFAVKLDTKSEVLGMAAHKRWVLLANWKDKSLMRNHVALGIARKFTETFSTDANPGIPWNSDGRFVEVVYNGVHLGNYYLCEQIKIDGSRLDIKKAYDSNAYPSITADDIDRFGYLIECDDNYDEEENGQFISKHFIPVMLKDAGDAGGVILNHIKDKITTLENNLYNGKYSDAYGLIDIYSFADQLLIYEMAMNSEIGHPKSAYLFMNGDSKIYAGPVWDFDWTSFPNNDLIQKNFDSSWDRDYGQSLMATPSHKNLHYRYSGSGYPSSVKKNDVPYMWYPMLVKDSTFKDVLAERWNAMSGILGGCADELILQTASEIAVSWEWNNSVWPAYYSSDCDRQATFSGGFCGDEKMATFEEVYTNLYNVYLTRLAGMDTFVGGKSWPSWTKKTASK